MITKDTTFGGKARTYYGRWTYKYDIAARKGAAGAIIIHNDSSAGYPWSVVANSWGADNLMLASDAEGSSLLVQAWFTDPATRKVLEFAGRSLDDLVAAAVRPDFRPVPLGVNLRATLNLSIRSFEGKNVIGRLPGSDSTMADEAVMFTSHHDHFGIGFPVDGDSVYNGALDNASGCAMTLELARAFSSLPVRPKRSLLFAFVTGEEAGLLGSKYLATHPTVPLRSVAALINIDGFNIYGKTEDITFLGFDRSSLGADIQAVAKTMEMSITPDPSPEQGHFYRSDHFSFAKVGVPCLSMGGGSRYVGRPEDYGKQKEEEYNTQRYHQPSDQLSSAWPWELDGMMQQVEFVTRLTLRVADAPAMPVWNAGDEFEAARLESMRDAVSR
jgi:Zn-dependent M28 family amino/carboxypeptidase